MQKISLQATIALLLFVPALPVIAQQEPPFDYPTPDNLGIYTILEAKRVGKSRIETVTQRKGVKTGNLAFTRRLVDCGRKQFQTLGSAFSREGLKNSPPDQT